MAPAARAWALGLSLLTFAAYGYLGSTQWAAFFFPSWDLGIFSSAVQEYARGSAPIVSIKGDHYNLLGDHFHPILVVLAPMWWLWPSPLMLLWVQAALFAGSVYPLTRYAITRFGSPLGVAAGTAYAFSCGLQGGQSVQFHEYAFGVLFLAWGLVALLENQPRTAALWVGALVFVKEDLGLTVMMLGFALWWRAKRAGFTPGIARTSRGPRNTTELPRTTIPLILAAWGAVWFVLATFVILPALNPAGTYSYTGNLAATAPGGTGTGTTGLIASLIGPATKWGTLALYVGLAGIVGFTSPLALALLPTATWRWLGSVEFYWGWQWHYNAILMPIVFAALLDALPRLRYRWRAASVGLSLLTTATLGASLPLVALVLHSPGAPTSPPERTASLTRAVGTVPKGASVAADLTLLAPLVPDRDVQWLHGDTKRAPECVAVANTRQSRDIAPRGYAAWANRTWPVSTTGSPTTVQVAGRSVVTSASSEYRTVYADEWAQVACQGGVDVTSVR